MKGVTSRWWKEECGGVEIDEGTALYSLILDTLFELTLPYLMPGPIPISPTHASFETYKYVTFDYQRNRVHRFLRFTMYNFSFIITVAQPQITASQTSHPSFFSTPPPPQPHPSSEY